jgi:hypothetical protein
MGNCPNIGAALVNTHQTKVGRLTALAREALAVPEDGDVEVFIQKTDIYLRELEAWQKDLGPEGIAGKPGTLAEGEKAELRNLVSALNQIHQDLITRASGTREKVGTAMGDLHKRATGMKKYIDRFPSRITIAGKRKG